MSFRAINRVRRDPGDMPLAPAAWLFAVATFGFVVACLVVLLVLLALPLKRALAHGPAAWIQQGGYKNSLGELCCGERDCFELPSSDVRITAGGYFVVSIKETIPFHEATPSPTGTYWRCQWGGARKCFFAPPGFV